MGKSEDIQVCFKSANLGHPLTNPMNAGFLGFSIIHGGLFTNRIKSFAMPRGTRGLAYTFEEFTT